MMWRCVVKSSALWIIPPMFLFLIFLDTVCANAFAEEFLTKDDPKGSWAEKILLKDLLHDYEKKARPVVDGVSPVVKFSETHNVQQVTIEFGLSLIQILDLNENEQILTTSVRTLYRWKDYHLVWDPAEYENITYVNIPTAKLWLPDIALYNHADERVSEIRVCDAQVDYKGTVQWQPRAIYKSACQVHIKYFPFDQQNCKMKFGPWTYDGARTNISFYNDFDALDLSDYEPSPEWDLVTTKAVYTATRYPCCPHIYPDITFSVVIKRQPAFYNYVIILPCFLLSSLTLVLFCLPPETPAKMQLGMNMFQAFNFLLLILTQSIPSAASSFPLIGTYYCINMLLVTLSTFLCLIVVNCHFRGDSQSEVPQWIKTIIIVYGARFLFVNVHSRPTKTRGEETTTKKLSNKLASEANSALAEAAHADRLMRSAGYRAPGLSGIRARDSLRSCACENLQCGWGEMPCYPTPYPSMECHGSCCQLNDQWGGPMPCPQSHCMLANRHQSSDQCCQNYLCECNQAASYREQEPPRLPTQYVSEATAHPKSPFTAEDDQSGKFCPACAGLAAAAATSDFGCNQLRRIGSQSNDLDAALVDVWASAATATTADQQQQQQQHHHPHSHHHHHHHQQHNHTSGVNQRRRELAFSEQNRPRNRVGDCPSGGGGGNGAVGGSSGRRAPSSPTANLEELLVGCINQPSQSNAELRGLGGHSRGFSADRHRRSDSKSELFYCDASETEPCQQCDAEAAAAAAMCDRETGGGGGSGCCPNNQGTKFGTNSGKPDIRVLRRVATVSRDIAEIVRGIRYFQKKNENKERLNKIVNEWRAVGSVLDRLFFICYLFAISISIILYFPRAADSL